MDTARIRTDFDQIARLSDCHGGETDRYDSFLLSLVPTDAVFVLEIGCGLGRLTAKLSINDRRVIGVDLSPEMIERARKDGEENPNLEFVCGDFLERDFTAGQFDCVMSAAVLHHMPEDLAVTRMVELLRPGGRLVIHDVRSDAGLGQWFLSNFALAQVAALRLVRTGWPLSPRPVREAWKRHCAGETYLTLREAEALAARHLPGSRVFYHWLWSYTIVWDKPNNVQ